ncbi:hypothetical protein KP509_33G001700 [Ceratopteris richardii]|uniref:Pentatricopeptide repeat-containing protein n=1 Tax=Ceratopteris richardii TaxID=49495 RepID=A0A8T2QMV6_CERRI|nr:hypothetical protein KP509_33G001700 [Ceratopteris richardii]
MLSSECQTIKESVAITHDSHAFLRTKITLAGVDLKEEDGEDSLKLLQTVFALSYLPCWSRVSSAGLMKMGQERHSETIEKGFEKKLYVANTLIDMNVFDKLLIRDVSSWTVMIQGYSMNQNCANLLISGQQIFKMMRETHNIIPSADHISCIMDLLARAGHLSEAEKLVHSSPVISAGAIDQSH